MLDHIRRAFIMSVICMVFFGFVYMFAGTGVAQLFFKHQADGSVEANGSSLIGQNWSEVKCPGHPVSSCVFHGRPTDTGPYATTAKKDITGGDDPSATGQPSESANTALGPRSQTLVTNTKELVQYWHKLGVPDPTADLVTTSGSGLTANITPADALVQVPMVAKATGVSPARLKALIKTDTHSAQFGFLGSPFVIVLTLNEGLAKAEHRS